MTAEVKYFCPQCQSMELAFEQRAVITSKAKVECQLCHWMGRRAELFTAIAPENETFWTGDRVANALLMVMSRRAAGPVVATLEAIGLVPKLKGDAAEKASAAAIREAVMKAILEAAVVAAFETTAALTPQHYQRFDAELAEPAERVFRYNEGSDDKS